VPTVALAPTLGQNSSAAFVGCTVTALVICPASHGHHMALVNRDPSVDLTVIASHVAGSNAQPGSGHVWTRSALC